MAETWNEISDGTVLNKGDLIRVYVQIFGTNTMISAALIDKAVADIERKDNRFRVEGYSLPNEDGLFFVKIRVVDPRPPEKQLAGCKGIMGRVATTVVLSALLAYCGFIAQAGMTRRGTTSVAGAVGGAVDDVAVSMAKWAAMAIVGYVAIKSVKGQGRNGGY